MCYCLYQWRAFVWQGTQEYRKNDQYLRRTFASTGFRLQKEALRFMMKGFGMKACEKSKMSHLPTSSKRKPLEDLRTHKTCAKGSDHMLCVLCVV